MRLDPHRHAAFAQGGRAGEQQAQQVHGVFPTNSIVACRAGALGRPAFVLGGLRLGSLRSALCFARRLVADVLLDLLELRHGVAVEGLENHQRQELLAQRQEFLAQWRDLLDQRRVETFQDVRVRLERHGEELLQFPVATLRGVVLELFRRAKQRPLQVGRREVDTAPVCVRIVAVPTYICCARTKFWAQRLERELN